MAFAEKRAPKLLFMSRETLMRHAASQVTEALFPETLAIAGQKSTARVALLTRRTFDVAVAREEASTDEVAACDGCGVDPGSLREPCTRADQPETGCHRDRRPQPQHISRSSRRRASVLRHRGGDAGSGIIRAF